MSGYSDEDLAGKACWTAGRDADGNLQSIGLNIMSYQYCADHSKDRFFDISGDICAGTPDLDGDGLTDGDKGSCHYAMYDLNNDYDGRNTE